MPKKTVKVDAKLQDNFRVEAHMGNHTVIIDQPKAGGGEDQGPNPLQVQLLALAGCLGAIGRIVANQEKLDLRGLDISVQGDLDTDFLLGQTEDGRAGFSSISATVGVDADMTGEEKREFLEKVDSRCPISDVMANGTDVSIELA